MKRLVLVGAGHAHARVLLDLVNGGAAGVEVVLVSPAPLAPYSGMVPGWMAGHYRWDECCIDFAGLCRRAGASLRIDTASAIEPGLSQLRLASGALLHYDLLSLDIGSTSDAPVAEQVPVLPMRPLAELKQRWEELRLAVCQRPAGTDFRVVMVGGGAAGTESILAVRAQLAQWAPQLRVDYALATQGRTLLPALSRAAGKKIARHLAGHRVKVIEGFDAARLDNRAVLSQDGRAVQADLVLWATGAKAHAWLAKTGLALDTHGFIQVDSSLRSVSHSNIFAAGDCASFATPLPKAGVFAVRMGPVLSHNLRACLQGLPLKAFVPQRRYLVLLGTGDDNAVAAWGPFSWQGKWVWRWKQRIDRRFLAMYNIDSGINT